MTTARLISIRFNDLRCGLDQSRIYDWTMRLPIIGYSLFVLGRDVVGFCEQASRAPDLFEHPDGSLIVATLARVSQWMFVALLAVLPIFRHRPVAKSESLPPRIGALLTVLLPPAFMLLERAPASLAFNIVAVAVSLAANVMSVLTLSFLGRSLSVMPEARRLVTDGPYALVRHPLYLWEMLGVVAIVLQYRSLSATALLLLIVALQVARARWEEAVLARAFPEFEAYRLRTSFLIPKKPHRVLALFFADPVARRRSAVVVLTTIVLLLLTLNVLPRLSG